MKNRFYSRLQAIQPSVKACFSMPALMVSAALSWSLSASAETVTYNTAGSYAWFCPPGVNSIQVECWGGGGAGGAGRKDTTAGTNTSQNGAGGGGGAYARRVAVPVTPGQSYNITIPPAAVSGTNGTTTNNAGAVNGGTVTFVGDTGVTVQAAGGSGGPNAYTTANSTTGTSSGGAGGTVAGSIGDPGAVFAGGNGFRGTLGAVSGQDNSSGGGGGGAGDANAGGSAVTGGTGAAGGIAGGGNGGNGRIGANTNAGVGSPGATPGGGGGGGKNIGVSTRLGGDGGLGQVVLTYTAPVNVKANNTLSLNDPSSWTVGVPIGNLAKWDNTVTSANTTLLGADLTFSGIQVADPAGPVTIDPGNTLTLGAAAVDIDMSTATQDLALNSNLALGAANVWDVGSGRTATLGGVVSGSAAVTKQGVGTAVLAGPNTYTGDTIVNAGTLNLTGSLTGNGTTTTGSVLRLGAVAGNATANIAGNINSYFSFNGGSIAGANTAINMTSGTLNFTSTSTGNTVNQINSAATGSYGSLNLTGGTINTLGRMMVSAGSGGGVAYIGGTGTLNATGEWFMVTHVNANALGSLTIGPGGTLNRAGASNVLGIFLSAAGQYGMLNLAGGDLILQGSGIRFGNGNGGTNNTGFLNLAAGTYQTNVNVTQNVGTSTGQNAYINLAGGTLKATGNLTAPFPNTVTGQTVTTTAYGPINNDGTAQDFTGGLTVNTNGNSVTLGNPMVAPSADGVARSSLTITGGSGYIGAPVVQFTGGTLAAGGAPAAGYAVVSGGQVTDIVITAPGSYTAAPTVTLTGGGGTGASVTMGALVANASGGLTKTGTGILTLTGSNTYTGATAVNGGRLVLSGTGTISGASALSVGGGAAFSYLPTTIGGTLTTSSLNLADGSALRLAWDASAANNIAATGAASVGSGVGVALDMGTGFTSGTPYTILTAASGLDVGNYSFLNLTDYTVGVVKTPTSVSITPTSTTPLAAAYWRGTTTVGRTKIWAATDGVSDSNWSATDGGATQGLVPGATADVFIPNTAPVVPATSTVLGSSMSIGTLTIADATNGMSLDADGNTLTITPGASTSGIVMNAGVPASSIAAPVALGAAQTWTNDSSNSFTVSGGISGGFALAKAGTGTLILPVANSFSGGLTIKGGTVALGTATSAGTGSLSFDNGGLGSASARYGSATALTVTNPVGVLTGSTASNSIVNDGSNNVTVNSAIDIATGTALTLANNNTGTFSLELGSSALVTGGGSIVTSGTSTGTLVFRGANTYSGGTTLGGSSVHVPGSSSNGPAGSPTDGNFGTGTLTIGSISIRSTTIGDTTIGNTLILAGDLTAVNGGASEKTLTFSGPATLTGTRTISSNLSASGKSLTFSGAIGESSSGLGLTKTGTGPLILSSAASTFTGPVVVSQGILQSNGTGTLGIIGAPSSLGTGNATSNATNAASLVLDGGTYSVTNTNAPVTTDRLFTLTQNGGVLSADNGTAADVVAFTNTAPIAYSGSGARTLTLGGAHPGGADANLFAPQITDAGADIVSLQKTGSTTWTLTNANTYTGATTITAGILQLGDGTSGNDGTIANTSGVTNDATLAFNRFGSSTAGYPITGTGAVTKLGAGTQTLSGLSAIAANNYSGATTIANGTLAFTTTNPSLAGGLVFGLAAGATTTGGLDLSASSAAFGSLTAQTNLATANTITIGNGKTLQINGAVTVGTTGGSTTTKLTATGLGSLSIGTSTVPTDASVAIGAGTGNNSGNNGTLDLSGLSTFYANLGTGTFRVGSPTNSGGAGGGAGSVAILAGNSTIQATNLTVGGQDTGATHYLRLGDGTNLLNADAITVGTSGRSSANVTFNGANGAVTVRGSAGGTSRANLTLVSTSFGTASNVFGTFDTTNHNADLMFGTMNVGVRSGSSGTGSATGTLSFNQGSLDVNDVLAGSVTNGTSTGSATGNVNLSGGTAIFNSSTNPLRLGSNADESRSATGNLNISGTANVSVAANGGNSIVLGNATVAGGTATGVVNLTGGTLTVAGDIIQGTATGTSNATLALSGGTLDMGGNDIGSGGGTVTVTAESGTLKNVASINGTGGLTKTTAGTLTLDGTNTYTGPTTISAGTLALGASEVVPNGSAVSIDAATLDAGTFDDSMDTLDVTAAAAINLGSGANLVFADSSAIDWTGGTLTITGSFVSGSSLRFGTTSSGLTPAQLALISATGFSSFSLNSSGYLVGSSGGYDSWKGANAGGQGPELDFDNDGTSNGVEYFMNAAAGFTANPQLNGSNTITWTNGGNIPASAYGTQFVVQTSSNMVNWTDVPVGQLTANTDGPGGSLTYTLTGAAPRFVRLVVTP